MLGFGEGGVGGFLVAHHERDRDIVRRLVPDGGGARLDCVLHIDDRGDRLIVDDDKLGGIARLCERFGDDESDTISNGAHPAAAENGTERPEAFGAAHVFGHDRHETAELVGGYIGASEHGQDTRGGLGCGGVDAFDPCVRVG